MNCVSDPTRPWICTVWPGKRGGVTFSAHQPSCDSWSCSTCARHKLNAIQARLQEHLAGPDVKDVWTAVVPKDAMGQIRKAGRLRGGGRLALHLNDERVIVISERDLFTQRRQRSDRSGWELRTEPIAWTDVVGVLRELAGRVCRQSWAGSWRSAPSKDPSTRIAFGWFRTLGELEAAGAEVGLDLPTLERGAMGWDPDGPEIAELKQVFSQSLTQAEIVAAFGKVESEDSSAA